MKSKKGRSWWILIVVVVVACAILAGYYFSREKLAEGEGTVIQETETSPQIIQTPEQTETPKIKEPIHPEAESAFESQGIQESHADRGNPCKMLEDQIGEFFEYLNGKNYIQRFEEGMDTKETFRSIVEKLSSNPPIPAGEGLDRETIIRNIFLFFRILGRRDIRIVKEILTNEADTLEMNLELFYEWLMSWDSCPDPDEIRPSFDTAYLYAGYLINTIGGKAYLTRRPLKTRLLLSYYCILILYEADKSGVNRYGIDVYPRIEDLMEEISAYSDFRFQDHYIEQLMDIQNYYYQKR